MRRQHVNRRRIRIIKLTATVLIATGAGLGIWAIVLSQQQPAPPPLTKLKAPDFTNLPGSANAPSKSEVNSYTVAPTLPKYISIPAVGVHKTEVLTLGLLTNGHIATPSSSYVTGWYKNSAKPGQNGAMFIYGHVAGWQTGGIFYNLKKLKAGDAIIVTRGDNKTYTYKVNTSQAYPYDKVPMNKVLSPAKSDVPGLNLMTCTGKLIPGSKPANFDHRLVVFASLAGGKS